MDNQDIIDPGFDLSKIYRAAASIDYLPAHDGVRTTMAFEADSEGKEFSLSAVFTCNMLADPKFGQAIDEMVARRAVDKIGGGVELQRFVNARNRACKFPQ